MSQNQPKLNLDDIGKIADLANLELTSDEKSELVDQFAEILGYFEKMSGAQLGAASPSDDPTPTHFRPDETVESGVSPAEFSPYLENGHFKVPKVIE